MQVLDPCERRDEVSDLLDRIKGCAMHDEFMSQIKELSDQIADRDATIRALRVMLRRTFNANGLPCKDCDKFTKLDVTA